MRIGIAQLNSTVGDFKGNLNKILYTLRTAKERKVDLVIFPELFLTGYFPKDLLKKPDFLNNSRRFLNTILKNSQGISVIIGLPLRVGKNLLNVAYIIRDGRFLGFSVKTNLSLIERDYFIPSQRRIVFNLNGKKFGITLGEDLEGKYDIIKELKRKGAELIINLSALPFYIGKDKKIKDLLIKKAKENNVRIIYCNLVGGNDQKIFDGGSMVVSEEGEVLMRAKRFEEDFIIYDESIIYAPYKEKEENELEEICQAIILGIKDYVKKNNFQKVILGLSGGIDSSVVATLATLALGEKNVVGLIMPGPYSSKESIEDAYTLAKNLGIEVIEIAINQIYQEYLNTLKPIFKDLPFDTTEENIQARIRGNLLMALANKFNYLVLATGNKSEMVVGYTTLYGDMSGGLAPIADLTKTEVYKLAEYLNKKFDKKFIPQRILTKKPSAELRPNQEDEKDLIPYFQLDEIIKYYLVENQPIRNIVRKGFSLKDVNKIVSLIYQNEFKRKQAPIKIILKKESFDFPITNKFYPTPK
ncbi:MAG: NAD+ synthase [candidate division WOR-3 bacterium]|nr:NAD+ synthase [candidate division WOR-3 bacterium]MCX7837078.1 NAD+ synthase [candidate division WOR-3 bacterium]MDW8114243.1 NAD+ synthase [candidate division WOR-3 bacterium]